MRLKLKHLMEYLIDATCASQLAIPYVPMGLIFASKKELKKIECNAIHLCPVCYTVLGCTQHVCCHCCVEKSCNLLCSCKCIGLLVSCMTFHIQFTF